MTLKELEVIFNRALSLSFSKKKFFLTFPVLLVCGVFVVFCRALAVGSSKWVTLSLTFLPLFLSSGLLIAAGVVITRIYYHEVKSQEGSYRKILKQSWEMLIGVSYLFIPLLLVYLLLWTLMGIFYLLHQIPAIGDLIQVLLAFGPFLLVLGSILLGVANLFILFFVTPEVALGSSLDMQAAEQLYKRVRENIFSHLILLVVGVFPLLIVLGILSLAASITGASFFSTQQPLSVALQWFFVMIPFCAILAPSVVFFFHFAAESFVWMRKKHKGLTQGPY